jgi:hypothetical protein
MNAPAAALSLHCWRIPWVRIDPRSSDLISFVLRIQRLKQQGSSPPPLASIIVLGVVIRAIGVIRG